MARRDGAALPHSGEDIRSDEARLLQHKTDARTSVAQDATLAEYPEAQRARVYLVYQSIQPHVEQGVALACLVGPKASLRTLQYRLAQYQLGGLVGLIRHPRIGKGQRRLPSNERMFIEGLALETPPRSVQSIYRELKKFALAQQWPIPSYRTTARIVAAIDPALKLLAHEGSAAYALSEELVHRQEVSRPNERWQADHAVLNLLVLDEHGKPVRCWLTVIEDEYSRAVAGFALSCSAPNAMHTALALHDAIWRKLDPRLRFVLQLRTDRFLKISCPIPSTTYEAPGA
jgi:putative transposase